MSHQSTQHRHLLLNSVPQTPQQHAHQPNLTAPIKHENDSDDDLVSVPTVPKVLHSPDEYDPECQCETCQLVRKLQAECTCEECRGTGQPGQSSENVPIANAVSPTNGQPSSSSIIQNNDVSTSEHTNANDQDDDHSRSSTPDYLPRFFDDESDSSSDDSEDGDSVDDNASCDNESANSDDKGKGPTSVKCPKCSRTFTEKYKLIRHYRGVHQVWKPYYCRWPKCNFASGLKDNVIGHANKMHFKSKNRLRARKYVGKQEEFPPNDLVLEQMIAIKFVREKKKRAVTRCVCPRCGRNLSFNQLQSHIRTHANPGYRCTWPNCGFFYSHPKIAKEHLSSDHLQVEKANSEQTNRYLVRVNPKTGETTKVSIRTRRRIEEDNTDNSEDEEYSSSDDNGDENRDDGNYKELVQESEEGNDNSDPDYAFRDSCLDDVANGDDGDHKMEIDNESLNSIVYSQPSTSYQNSLAINDNLSNLGYNESANLDKEDPTPVKCPKCVMTFTKRHKILRHYRRVHQELKPFYCRWPKCNFAATEGDIIVEHANNKHFKSQNRQNARKYVGKQDETPPKDPVLEQIVAIKFDNGNQIGFGKSRVSCPRCGRSFYSEHLKSHIRTHTNPGYSCTWHNCGFFYSSYIYARKHLLKDHFKGKLVNATQINEHLIKVDPILSNSDRFHDTIQYNDASTSERINANDQDDDHSRSSTPDYLPRFFDNESGDSSCEDDDLVDDGVDQENESGDNDSDDSVDEDDDDKKLDQKNGHDDNSNDPEYAFLNSPTFACPQCQRIMFSENHLKTHILSHANPGIRCTWSQCGFFYSQLYIAMRHVCVDHLQVDKINSKYINKHLINVNPRTGETTKVICRPRRQRKEDNSDNSENEEDSDSDDDSERNEQ